MNESLLKLLTTAGRLRGLAPRLRAIRAVLKEFAPYAAIELILPGGSVIAILCWLYRRKRRASSSFVNQPSTNALIQSKRVPVAA